MSGFYSRTKNYGCQICIIRATGCQNLGRLNRRLSEVLSNHISHNRNLTKIKNVEYNYPLNTFLRPEDKSGYLL